MFHLMSRSCAVTIAKTTTAAHKDRAPQRVKIPGGGRYGAAPWTPWTPWTPLCTRIFENWFYKPLLPPKTTMEMGVHRVHGVHGRSDGAAGFDGPRIPLATAHLV